MRYCRLPLLAALAPVLLSSVVFAQGNSEEGRLRAPNAQTLQLRGLLYNAGGAQQAGIASHAGPVLEPPGGDYGGGSGTYTYQVRAGNINRNSVWIGARVSVQ